jgi:hypothetical protein
MPAFLLSMAGPYLNISGAIYLDGIVSASLVGYNSLVPQPSSMPLEDKYTTQHDRMVWHTAHTFQTLRYCLDELDTYYGQLQDDIIIHPLGPTPCFKAFTLGTSKVELTYRSRLVGDSRSERVVFLADAAIGPGTFQCVVKFTQWYGKQAHDIMKEAGVAPKLLYCNWEESIGLWVVVTEYIETNKSTIPSEEGIEQLRKGLTILHDNGLVHGDIRHPNILVDSHGQPLVIDYDWSRPVGTARYPALLNKKVWPSKIKPGTLIQPQHDLEMLERYEKEVKELRAS